MITDDVVKLLNLENADYISPEGTLQSIDELFDSYEEYAPASRLFIITISMRNGKGIHVVTGDDMFKKSDLDKISKWWFSGDHRYYKKDFYKLDTDGNYLIFKSYEYPEYILFIGHAVKQTLKNKLLFLEMRQDHLREILH